MDIITFEKACTIQNLTYKEIDILIDCLDLAIDPEALDGREDMAMEIYQKLVDMHRPDRKLCERGLNNGQVSF